MQQWKLEAIRVEALLVSARVHFEDKTIFPPYYLHSGDACELVVQALETELVYIRQQLREGQR